MYQSVLLKLLLEREHKHTYHLLTIKLSNKTVKINKLNLRFSIHDDSYQYANAGFHIRFGVTDAQQALTQYTCLDDMNRMQQDNRLLKKINLVQLS